MNLTPDQIHLCLYSFRDLVARRTLGGQPIPNGFADFLNQLLASADGSETARAETQLAEEELIDSTAAAQILNCSTRWVREIHNDLGGRNINGRWIFHRQTVVEYAEGRHQA